MNTILRPLTLILATVLIFFVLLFAYVKLAGPIPFSVTSTQVTKNDTFTAAGEGRVAVRPDVAIVSVGITANASTVKQAQDQTNTVINKISASVKQLGVKEEDIKTANYNINPNYDFRGETQKITGYQANTNVTIKVRDIDKANSVIDTATANGATQVGGISFDVDDRTKAQNEAREKAVAEAKKNAEQAAKIAGFRLGRIINYNENFGGGGPIPTERSLKMDSAIGQAAPTQIEPGSQEIVVSVWLSYDIH